MVMFTINIITKFYANSNRSETEGLTVRMERLTLGMNFVNSHRLFPRNEPGLRSKQITVQNCNGKEKEPEFTQVKPS